MCENGSLTTEIVDGTLKASKELIRLPDKSRERYAVTFKKYLDWCKKMGTKEEELTNEKVLISYFNNLISKDNKPPTLWSNYSMIRSMIAVNKNVDISKHSNLLLLLKRKSVGYIPRKSKTFDRRDVSTFLLEANDYEFLLTKVAFIIGLAGACKKKELTAMTTDNVKDKGDYFHFVLRNAKMKVYRDFVVTAGNIKGVNLVDLIRKYVNLRPRVNHNRFFIQYTKGVCTRHPVGINTLGGLPRKIAKHLKLKNPEQYTGHCLRRSCTLLLAGAGADISTMKHYGGWKSSLVTEGYFSSSVENNQRIAAKIFGKNGSKQEPYRGDAPEMLHVSFKPSSSTYQAIKEMDVVVENPSECTFQQSTAKFSPLVEEISSRDRINNVEYTENVIKLETYSSPDPDNTSDLMETEEANEYCEEFNKTEAAFLNPPENLKLVHLDKRNTHVNEGRNSDSSPNMPVNNSSVLQIKSLNALNSVAENYITINPFLESRNNKTVNNMSHVRNSHQDIEFVHVPGVIKRQVPNSQVPTTQSSSGQTLVTDSTDDAQLLSVETVAEKVMQRLLSSTSRKSQVLHAVLESSAKQTPSPTVDKSLDKSSADLTNNHQVQDIGSKILRMFVIDKQMEELMQEKRDIYKELFSIGELSLSLFHSWAQEKIRR